MQLTTHQLTTQEAILKRLYPWVSIEEAKKKELQDDWSVLNKPIYVLQKSSQSREVQEESTSPTESEKKDFWKRFMKFMWQKYQFFMNEWNSEKIENFLSSNWYL